MTESFSFDEAGFLRHLEKEDRAVSLAASAASAMELAAQLADPEDQPAYRELLDRTRRIRRFTAARRERMDEILYCVRSAADRAAEVIERSISEAARRELILK